MKRKLSLLFVLILCFSLFSCHLNNEPKITMPHSSSYYNEMSLNTVVDSIGALGFTNFELIPISVSSILFEFYDYDTVNKVRFGENLKSNWDAGKQIGVSQVIYIYYYPKTYVILKEENPYLLMMHEEVLSSERLGSLCCSWSDICIEIEGYVNKKLNQNLIWFTLDSNKDDNISGSTITVDVGYKNHIKEGEYIKMICKVDDRIASISGHSGFDADFIKFV